MRPPDVGLSVTVGRRPQSDRRGPSATAGRFGLRPTAEAQERPPGDPPAYWTCPRSSPVE